MLYFPYISFSLLRKQKKRCRKDWGSDFETSVGVLYYSDKCAVVVYRCEFGKQSGSGQGNLYFT